MQDSETRIRLIFLGWYACAEPEELTELGPSVPAPADVINQSGVTMLTPEEKFVVAYLAHLDPHGMGNEVEWSVKSEELFLAAENEEPGSRLFASWRFLAGREPDVHVARTLIREEMRARFHGRGAMGDYLEHMLSSALPPGV